MVAILDLVNTITGSNLDCGSHITQKMQNTGVSYTTIECTVAALFSQCADVENSLGEGLTDEIFECIERQNPNLYFLQSTKRGLSTQIRKIEQKSAALTVAKHALILP